jgi:hypothetical protein
MSLNVNSQIVAHVAVAFVELRALAGAFELHFGLSLTPTHSENAVRWIALHGARISLRTYGGGETPLGVARPDQLIRIRQTKSTFPQSASLFLSLQPPQLGAIEDFRLANDITFLLSFSGEGGTEGEPGEMSVHDQLQRVVPQSDWIAQLQAARALDILLVEIPMPFDNPSEAQVALTNHIRQAQRHFLNGHYRETVADCRAAMECLGVAATALDPIATRRSSMTKDERLQAVLASIRHLSHIAHHATGSGSPDFDRAEAKLLLQLTAAAASFAK